MLTEIEGVRVGHWTDPIARTGCTVVRFPDGTVASGEVRGGAPATREFALLDPLRTVERLDAVVLSGGSAFGLAAADGAVGVLTEEGVGFATGAGPVPIVVGMCLYDLAEGDGSVRPGASEGRRATLAASAGPVPLGRTGAGAGATVGNWRGPDHTRPGGLGGWAVRVGDLVVAALIAVNAAGDIDDGGTVAELLAGSFAEIEVAPFGGADAADSPAPVENTTIGVVATNARLTKAECHLVAQSCHDGYGRALVPVHTAGDGDAVVVAATGAVDARVGTVRLAALVAVEQAIRQVSAAEAD
ncbi:MAG: P1 family peptidase [Acidimicrobiales bacterium]|nr:P1 family peptidase [Acidimicrobiales bacterium]